MTFSRLFSTGILGLVLTAVGLPAMATPEIASGDRMLDTNIDGCLTRADTFVSTLDIQISRGEIDRTGYFDDGAFRILCYPNPYSVEESSMVVVFAAHDSDFDVATTFVQIALEEMDVQ